MTGRLAYIERAPFEAALALAALTTAIVYVFDPDLLEATAVSREARNLLPVWQALYGSGGLVILVGLFLRSVRVELAGLSLLAAALIVNSVAVITLSTAGLQAGIVYAALVGACGLRARFLWASWRAWKADNAGAGG